MNVLDLFSGIGGFSLGLERAGMRTVAFCEIDPFCRRVLAKHWPRVPCYEDVRTLTADRLRADGIAPDVICGGFPCQDISYAGSGAGIEGARSGLWGEYARLIGEVRPRFVIVENVSALLSRGLDRVLGDLAALGYDAEWHCIPASAVGAPHLRDRIWIVAKPQHSDADESGSYRAPLHQHRGVELRHEQIRQPGSVCQDVAHPEGLSERPGLRASEPTKKRRGRSRDCGGENVPDAAGRGQSVRRRPSREDGYAVWLDPTGVGEIWRSEPDVGRVADGVPDRVDRLTALGNAVVPQIPEIIGSAIMKTRDFAQS